MKTINAHFDGKVLVPDEPVQLPVNEPLRVSVALAPEELPFLRVLRQMEPLPDNAETPRDLAAQHDHYLHGAPKRS